MQATEKKERDYSSSVTNTVTDPSLELLHNFLVATVWFLPLINHLLFSESTGINLVSSSLLFGLLLLLFSAF